MITVSSAPPSTGLGIKALCPDLLLSSGNLRRNFPFARLVLSPGRHLGAVQGMG
jgi:hypothetical protein